MRVDNPAFAHENNILKTALCASLLATAGTASAKALDDALDCHSTGHKFVAPLLAAGDIQSEPMHVESNSVNAFRTSHALTAYGFGVYVVLGYQANDPIFRPGDGTPIGDWPTASWCGARKRGGRSRAQGRQRRDRQAGVSVPDCDRLLVGLSGRHDDHAASLRAPSLPAARPLPAPLSTSLRPRYRPVTRRNTPRDTGYRPSPTRPPPG